MANKATAGERYPRGIRTYRFGTQGWTYFADWVGTFYPPRMAHAEALTHYARLFDTVEINATFHGLPTESTVRSWYEKTPEHFLFALKAPREITHDLRLEWPAAEARTWELLAISKWLKDKVGPILVQLPPSFEPSSEHRQRLWRYIDVLRQADARVALELRHPAWSQEQHLHELQSRNVAWVLIEAGDQSNARSMHTTADFAYVRWNRSGLPMRNWSEIQHDRSTDLDWWAQQLQGLPKAVHTVFGYMSNEFAGHAPASLNMLSSRLGLPVTEPRTTWPQQVLF